MAECLPGETPEVVVGSTIVFRAGPFRDSAGDLVDFTTGGWSATLTVRLPSGVTLELAGAAGTAEGYIECVSNGAADALGFHKWRAAAENPVMVRHSERGEYRVVAVV